MALSLTIPEPGEKASTKDYIITLLGHDWPLPTKRIFHLIKKRYGHHVTYQAVFKTLQELLAKGIVEKSPEGYQINLKWLKYVHTYTEMIESNYYTKNRLQLIEGIKEARKEGNINVLTFETLFDVEKYLYYLQKHYILTAKKKETICVHHAHEWRPLFYLRAEYNWIRKIRERGHQTYVLCAGDSFLDRWCAAFYAQTGCQMKLKVNCANPAELMVFDDIVIQVYLPQGLKEEMEKQFLRIKDMQKMDHSFLIRHIFEKKSEIQVIIHKDAKLAEQVRTATMKEFGSVQQK